MTVQSARSFWWYFFLIGLPILAGSACGAALWLQQDISPLSWLEQTLTSNPGSETNRVAPELSFRHSSGPINQPLELGITLNNGTGGEILVLSGFSPGTSFSAGASLSATRWSLPGPDIANAFISAPANFRGTMPVKATLYSPAHDVLEAREINFEWIGAEAESAPADMDRTGNVSSTDSDSTQQGRLSDAFGSVSRGNNAQPTTDENAERPPQPPGSGWHTTVFDWLSRMSSNSSSHVDQPIEPSLAPQSPPATGRSH